ncbi:ABC transporter ATP-binding protein [Micrococcales bacterium 31B]|nr:ABC transporter ATP-binding protein [Micrococcales bacterium 31B]
MSKPLLRVDGLHVEYGDQAVVHDVSFDLAAGERLAIVGQSGSGKSTTIAAVLGLLPGAGRVTAGRIEFAGRDLTHADDRTLRPLRGTRLALIPQDPMSTLNPTLRVGDQIADALRAYGMTGRAAVQRRVVELLTEAGVPDAAHRRRAYPHQFSGGLRQRVLIAMALAGEPELIVADEPTSALDVTVQKQILDHLAQLVERRGLSLLLVTHDLGIAADRTDGILVMHEGRVVERGESSEVLRAPRHEYTRALVAAAPTLTVAPTTSLPTTSASAPAEPPVLELRGLTKVFRLRGGRMLRAVDDVSVTVAEGQTTAVIGESGSGKTTTARMLLGLERPTAGTVVVDGSAIDFTRRADVRRLRRFVQPVFQDPYSSLNPMLSIEQIVREPLDVFRLGSRPERAARVQGLLEAVALPRSAADKRPAELSGGQRQRVGIARALASTPRLLLCDEAVSALDVLVQEQILDLLRSLQRELGVSCLFITHDLAVVADFAESVVVMKDGRVVESGATADVISAPREEYTKLLLDAVPGVRRGAA